MASTIAISSAILSSLASDPTTPAYSDDLTWITAYLTIHSLSTPSYRYPFLLWIIIALIFLSLTLLHWTRLSGGFIGAYWNKWAIRQRTWRKKHALEAAQKSRSKKPFKQPFTFPSNGQIFTLTVLSVGVIILCLSGPDYINPSISVWNFSSWYNNTSTPAVSVLKRDITLDPSTLTTYLPQYTISKSLWTSSARFGNLAFALFPLSVLFALKAPPFALFAIPYMFQYHFDKLALLHRWSGWIIWLVTAGHVILWSVQLSRDVRQETGLSVWSYVWLYDKFVYGWVAFGLLTLINIFSLPQFRTHFYDFFYFMHVLLIPLTLVFAALHHPPVWWWLWAAFGLWIGERFWRLTWWLYVNGSRKSKSSSLLSVPASSDLPKSYSSPSPGHLQVPHLASVKATPNLTLEMNRLGKSDQERPPTQATLLDFKSLSPYSTIKGNNCSTTPFPSMLASTTQYIPPVGYAHATLLPGRTIRLCILTPGYITWAPGQHFLIGIPSVSMFSTHPFTCASICDELSLTQSGRLLVFIIRSKSGWTKKLSDMVEKLSRRNRRSHNYEIPPEGWGSFMLPVRGIILRAFVDGPFGSSVRYGARWGDYEAAVVVAGGSGISFAVSIVQFLCLCFCGREGNSLGASSGNKFRIMRIRLVWIVREFSHIQWCASMIRRCMSLVSSDNFEVSIFITNSKVSISPQLVSYTDSSANNTPYHTVKSVPPTRPFASQPKSLVDSSPSSVESVDEVIDNDMDLSYYFGGDIENHLDHEEHILDYTNFDGDDDTALPGEQRLSRHLRTEGKVRRQRSLRASKMLSGIGSGIGRIDEDDNNNNDSNNNNRRTGKHSRLGSNISTEELLPYLHSPSSSVSQIDDYIRSHHNSWISALSNDRLLLHVQPSPSSQLNHSRGRDHSNVFENFLPSTPGASSSHVVEQHPRYQPTKRTVAQVFDDEQEISFTPISRPQTAASNIDSRTVEEDNGNQQEYIQESFNHFAKGVEFELDPVDFNDMRLISEVARPGRPRLDLILADELRRAKGSMIVACCGPNSLNALMRKIVAANIDPSRVLRGDKRALITLISEEFDY